MSVNQILGDILCGDQFSEGYNDNMPTTTSGNTTIIYDAAQYMESCLEQENPEGKNFATFKHKTCKTLTKMHIVHLKSTSSFLLRCNIIWG